ncbi:TPA: polyribonucleotide nucleotidyltransferase [Candidatus Bipolaricaulota bacterium]|nr:polyribonucleotide nucleotidyltransferase [Candidatus Bipolaricaulota bacterium]
MRLNKIIVESEGPFRLEAGRIARQADGSVLVTFGDTKILATATRGEAEALDYFPLIVDYEEKFYAGGKIPGGFFKREGKPSDEAILHARLIDRPIRPLFPKGYMERVHLVVTVLSADRDHPPEIASLLGASTALLLSSIPFTTPVAGVQLGRVAGRLIVNPTAEELEQSDLDVIVAGTKEAVTMVEGSMKELPEEEVITALEFAHQHIKELCAFQESFISQVEIEKLEVTAPELEELKGRLGEAISDRFQELRSASDKLAREELIKEIKEEAFAQVLEGLSPALAEGEETQTQELERNLSAAFDELLREFVRRTTLESGLRIDNRSPEEIRPIEIEVGLLPRVHGSALFTRGETQALGTCTLGTTRQDEQIIDRMLEEGRKRFMLHYNFPPYSVGEAGRMGPPSRREIGHGHLAENALQAVLPTEEEFPYIIRVVSEILESNGSSSMATVCSSSLAMMDAGVPLKAPVAGIALGLIQEGDDHLILTDIIGMEDRCGDMDFKIAGTRRGVTAFQLDVKTGGLSREILEEALKRAHQARMEILERMEEALPSPRPRLSPYAPVLEVIHVNPDRLGLVIGPGGRTIRRIIDQTETEIDIEDDGTVRISGPNREAVERAIAIVEELTEELEVGKRYRGKVTRIERYGAFVELPSGVRGLVHVSDLADGYVKNVEDIVKVGDEITVEVIGINEMGRPDFRRILEEDEVRLPAPPRERERAPRRPPSPSPSRAKAGPRAPRDGREEARAQARPQPQKREVKAGEVFTGTVKNIADFGAFVELDDSGAVGLIHISELSDDYVKRVEDVVRPGDRVAVRVLKIDNRGRIYLKRLARPGIKIS